MLLIDFMLSPKTQKSDGVLTRPPAPSRETPITLEEQPISSPASSCVEHPTPVSQSVRSRCLPWLASIVYPLARFAVLPIYFRRVEISGREHFPKTGPVIIAATHRSRWDALMVPCAVGQDITGRILRFMVTVDEIKGIQGWFIRRLGGFPINTRQPAIAALRHSIDLLQQGEALVIFPEGNIYRQAAPLKPGLARLALQAEASQPNLNVQIVPITIQYSKPLVPWRSAVKIHVHMPLSAADYSSDHPKQGAKRLTADLERSLRGCCQ
ncbi:1-acyl-sn-glycerol-3-phosphate acyltransferase [Pseudanabaenaceae cyanobacterium LEGE 13415]|nr:1-acyl-sn-glycerol-3-phosphate acyltransferase [Pseudanabaenaceae cyanobacterium LEGE 13415]